MKAWLPAAEAVRLQGPSVFFFKKEKRKRTPVGVCEGDQLHFTSKEVFNCQMGHAKWFLIVPFPAAHNTVKFPFYRCCCSLSFSAP
jgi:hypothetical protein